MARSKIVPRLVIAGLGLAFLSFFLGSSGESFLAGIVFIGIIILGIIGMLVIRRTKQ